MAYADATATGPHAVVVDHLAKSYGRVPAVRDVSFQVQPGEIFGLIGPNGSGKTTTVECLQGLRAADGGRLQVLGLDPGTQAAALRRRIGSQLQESSLPDRIKVWEALALFAADRRTRRDLDRVIETWGLAGVRGQAFGSLSGGQRQRLFVALALVNSPELVFRDEMTTGLDPAARRETWSLVESIRDRGTTVVLVTHFMDEARRLCDRIAVVSAGRVVALDTPSGLVAAHGGGVRVTFTCTPAAGGAGVAGWLRDVPGLRDVRLADGQVEAVGAPAIAVRIGHALAGRGLEPDDYAVHRPTLEDVYLALTQAAPPAAPARPGDDAPPGDEAGRVAEVGPVAEAGRVAEPAARGV